MARGVHGSGRTQQIREFLSKHCNEAFTPREVRDAVEPGASVDVFSATMTSLASRGDIARLGAGKSRVHYFWPRGMATIDKRRCPGSGTAAAARRRLPGAKPRAAAPTRTAKLPRSAAPAREAAKAIGALAAAKRAAAPRRAASNFLAPIAIADPTFNAQRAASARLAADIAEFERKGGRIERLGVTKLFHHPDDCQE